MTLKLNLDFKKSFKLIFYNDIILIFIFRIGRMIGVKNIQKMRDNKDVQKVNT